MKPGYYAIETKKPNITCRRESNVGAKLGGWFYENVEIVEFDGSQWLKIGDSNPIEQPENIKAKIEIKEDEYLNIWMTYQKLKDCKCYPK